MNKKRVELWHRFALLVLFLTFLIGIFQVVYPLKYLDLIKKYATENNLDPALVASVIHAESRFRKDARSPKDARGLMQLAEITANWGAEELAIPNFSLDLLYDPETNIKLGTWYLHKLYKEFSTSEYDTVLAAYNAGSGNVTKWLLNPNYSHDEKNLYHIPYIETRNYIKRVTKANKIYHLVFKLFYK